MTAPATIRSIEQWRARNDEYLATAVAWVRSRLDGLEGGPDEDSKRLRDELVEAAQASPPPALVMLGVAFDLTDFEQDIVLLCAAAELDTGIGARCGTALGDAKRPHPSFALAMAVFDGADWGALSPVGALRRWPLVELDATSAEPLTQRALRLDERILHFVKGMNVVDQRLGALLRRVEGSTAPLPPSQQTVARAVEEAARAQPGSLLQLVGPNRATKRAVATAVAAAMGLDLHELPVTALPANADDSARVARLWRREARLLPLALLVDADEVEWTTARELAVTQLADGPEAPVFLTRRAPPARSSGSVHDVAVPTPAEQHELWQRAVGGGWAERLASEFDLDASEIALVAAGASGGGDVWARARAFGRPPLEALAQRLTPRATWDDIVLAPEPTRLLHTLAAQVRHRSVVYDEWGWRRRTERGLGISALFTGESGTGKTMAAEVLANDLDIDLYRVDLSGVVSKYIGETEKNLRALFDAVERGGAILFFDEADALFGKRSEVRDSHDRYANIEVDYLLQRMESFRGLAILATNLRTALDPAFTRRLRFIVPFALPGQSERERMWRRAFPPQMPLDGVDPVRLARLNLSGALIHSIALHASFLAADAASPVTMSTVLDAARTELRKLERPTNDVDSL